MSSKKPVIAVDLDDVLSLSVPKFIQHSNEKWGSELTIENFSEDWSKTWGVDIETAKERADYIESAKLFNQYKHFEDAVEILVKLREDFELTILTARRLKMTKDTKDWIEKHFPNLFSDIYHAGIWDDFDEHSIHKTKSGTLLSIGADYLIDDQPKHCISAASQGIESLLFGDYPWNRDAKLPKKVVRVKDWKEVGKYFAS